MNNTAMSDALIVAQEKYRKNRRKLPGSVIPEDVFKTLEFIEENNPQANSISAAVWWCVRECQRNMDSTPGKRQA